MFLEILSFTFLGILFGTFTGLTPGIHVNSVCVTLPAFSSLLLAFGIPLHAIAAFVISMSIAHTILDFIPSIFLGVPEASTALSILPGHKLLLQGKGLEALFLTVIGGIFTTLLFVLLTPILLLVLPIFYLSIKFYIAYVLIFIASFMILTEKELRKIFFSFLVFLFSGILGVIVIGSSLLSESFVFFPLFTGLFGVSTLLISLKTQGKIPPQEDFIWHIDKKPIFSGILKSFFSSLLVGTLPGVGAAQATILAQETTRRRDVKEFLISVGGINTAVAISSILSLYTIQKSRSGAAVVIEKILGEFGMNELFLLISVSLITVGISAILTLKIGKIFLKMMQKIPYQKVSIFTIIFLIVLAIILTGPLGLFIMLIATAIGLIAPLSDVKRSHSMGVLLLPVILFYLGISVGF